MASSFVTSEGALKIARVSFQLRTLSHTAWAPHQYHQCRGDKPFSAYSRGFSTNSYMIMWASDFPLLSEKESFLRKMRANCFSFCVL